MKRIYKKSFQNTLSKKRRRNPVAKLLLKEGTLFKHKCIPSRKQKALNTKRIKMLRIIKEEE